MSGAARRTLDGKHPDGWIPEQKITVEEALRCYTANNAYAIFAEHELGRIAPGYLRAISPTSPCGRTSSSPSRRRRSSG